MTPYGFSDVLHDLGSLLSQERRLFRQWRQRARLAAVLAEQLLDLARGAVERLARAHLADQRLVQPQADDLVDLRAFRVAQVLRGELLRFQVRGEPAEARLLREV